LRARHQLRRDHVSLGRCLCRWRMMFMRELVRRSCRLLAVLLLGILSVPAARAAEPSCPAGEITLATRFLSASRKAAGADRLDAPSSPCVLPDGVSIDPATEPVSVVVEGDHQLLHQADIPAGALVPRAGGTAFILRAAAGAVGLPAGSRFVIHRS